MAVSRKSKVIEFPIGDAYLHEYRLRQAGSKDMALEVTVPRDFIRRLLRESGLPYNEFLKRCKVVVYYCGGDELLYQFEIEDEDLGGYKKDEKAD